MTNPRNKCAYATTANLLLLLSIALIITGCAGTKVSAIPLSDEDLTGSWVLNQDLSADTQGAIRYAMTQSRESAVASSARGDMRGGGGRRGGSGAKGGRSRNAGQERAPREPRERIDILVAELSPSTGELAIEQSATELTVRYGHQWEYTHGFDEKRTVSIAGYDGERISGWQEHQFIVETKTEGGATITERFSLVPDGSQLRITLIIDSERLPDQIAVTRVFDRFEAPGSSTTSEL